MRKDCAATSWETHFIAARFRAAAEQRLLLPEFAHEHTRARALFVMRVQSGTSSPFVFMSGHRHVASEKSLRDRSVIFPRSHSALGCPSIARPQRLRQLVRQFEIEAFRGRMTPETPSIFLVLKSYIICALPVPDDLHLLFTRRSP